MHLADTYYLPINRPKIVTFLVPFLITELLNEMSILYPSLPTFVCWGSLIPSFISKNVELHYKQSQSFHPYFIAYYLTSLSTPPTAVVIVIDGANLQRVF